jgi:hypothetical protein
METMLFTRDSIFTMMHGLVFGGGAMLALAAGLFGLRVIRVSDPPDAGAVQETNRLVMLLVAIALLLWLTIIGGTYIAFPPYRATPPEGVTDLSQYPRSFLLANPGTAWLHAFAMEIKEHAPWLAAMMATAVAFVGRRYRTRLLTDASLRRMASTLLAITFVMVACVAVLGVFINKVAPLD